MTNAPGISWRHLFCLCCYEPCVPLWDLTIQVTYLKYDPGKRNSVLGSNHKITVYTSPACRVPSHFGVSNMFVLVILAD